MRVTTKLSSPFTISGRASSRSAERTGRGLWTWPQPPEQEAAAVTLAFSIVSRIEVCAESIGPQEAEAEARATSHARTLGLPNR